MINGARAAVQNASSRYSPRVQEMIRQLAKLKEEKHAAKMLSDSVSASSSILQVTPTANVLEDGSCFDTPSPPSHKKDKAMPAKTQRFVPTGSHIHRPSLHASAISADPGNDGPTPRRPEKPPANKDGRRSSSHTHANAKPGVMNESVAYSAHPHANSTLHRPQDMLESNPRDDRRSYIDRGPGILITKELTKIKSRHKPRPTPIPELDELVEKLQTDDLESTVRHRTGFIDDSVALSGRSIVERSRTTKKQLVTTKDRRRVNLDNHANTTSGPLNDTTDAESLVPPPRLSSLLESKIDATNDSTPKSLLAKKSKERRARQKLTPTELNFRLVSEAALAVLSILRKHRVKSALFGSFASKLYGAPRMPNDVDLLTFPKPGTTDEQIKRIIAKGDKRFFLKHPKNRKNKYRILWYRPQGIRKQKGKGVLRECKVDMILVPGTMDLPDLRPRAVGVRWFAMDKSFEVTTEREVNLKERENRKGAGREFPVLPFPVVLLHKLQGWSDHRVEPAKHKRVKQHQDVDDVRNLLGLESEVDKLVVPALASPSLDTPALPLESPIDTLLDASAPIEAESNIPIPSPFTLHPLWSNTKFFPPSFLEVSKKRIRLYCHYFPETRETWARMGFEVHPRDGEVEAEAGEVERILMGNEKVKFEKDTVVTGLIE